MGDSDTSCCSGNPQATRPTVDPEQHVKLYSMTRDNFSHANRLVCRPLTTGGTLFLFAELVLGADVNGTKSHGCVFGEACTNCSPDRTGR